MAEEKIVTIIEFGNRKPTLDELLELVDDLERIAILPPSDTRCTHRIIDVSSKELYFVKEVYGKNNVEEGGPITILETFANRSYITTTHRLEEI